MKVYTILKKYFVPIFIWIIFWELFSVFYNDASIVPSLLSIAKNIIYLFFETDFFSHHLIQSLQRFGISCLIAVLMTYILSFICLRNKLLDSLITTFVDMTFPLPKIALLPLFLLFFGIGDLSKIIVISVSIFYLIFINTYQGIQKLTQSELADVITVYKVRGINYWLHFVVHGSFNNFLIGLKTGLNYGLTLVVVSEYSLSNGGLGYFIWSSWDQFRILDMYSGIAVIGILGYSLNKSCTWLIQRQRY